jgi:hypothetical protein
MQRYYHVATGATTLIEPTADWLEDYYRRFPCLHRPNSDAIDVAIQDPPEHLPLNCVNAALVNMVRSDLLEVLNPEATQHLSFGRVFDSSMKLLPELKTIGSKSRLIVRGGPKSTRHFCPQCGIFMYYPLGSEYLLQSNLDERPIYLTSPLGIVIGDTIYARLRKRRWKKLFISRLKVLSEPVDGLPADLSRVTPANLPLAEKQEPTISQSAARLVWQEQNGPFTIGLPDIQPGKQSNREKKRGEEKGE